MTKLLRFTGVALLALTIGVFGCDDDDPVAPTVTVTVPPPLPPPPPPPPPLAATMSPDAQTIGVGGTVVFAVSVSGGVAGEVASWTCASSDPSKATVSVIAQGCQATAVAAGGTSITAVVTKGGATTNAGAGLTITEDTVKSAFMVLASIEDSDDADDVLSGKVRVTLNVERGDETLMQLSVLVDGVVAANLPFGDISAVTAPQDAPAQQAVHAFVLSFNSAKYDTLTGEPTYLNGERKISAELMVASSDEPIKSGVVAREFANDDGVQVAVGGLGAGAMNSATGQMWYGGPAAMIEITAVPVLYSGGSASSLGMREFCGAAAARVTEAPFVFTPTCKGTSGEDGDTPKFTITAVDVEPLNGDDLFPLYLDFDGPSAPTFSPNPNGREGGWINLAVALTGKHNKTTNKDGWLTYNDDDKGVGGYTPRLRYAAKPKTGKHIDAAIAAPILTPLNRPGESKVNAYCAVASAVDALGNESDLPNAEKDGGTCKMAGTATVEKDIPNNRDAAAATGYMELLENAMADNATDAQKEALANAGLLVGVDITPPAVEFLAASLKDEVTSIGTSPRWGLHVADRVGVAHTDPLAVSIEVRDAETTTKFKKAEKLAADVFTIKSRALRHDIEIQRSEDNAREGYYSFSATAMDAAGNESAEVSRMALHDKTPPDEPGLFLAPAGDGYATTVVLSDNLSIKSYSTAAVLPKIGDRELELIAAVAEVDVYNAPSLTPRKTVQGTLNLPYLALQNGNQSKAVQAITDFKVYVTDQFGAAQSSTDDITVDISDIEPVVFRKDGLTVKAPIALIPKAEDDIKVTVTADMDDNLANLDAPFSVVRLYATVKTGGTEQLSQVGIVPAGAAETELTGTDGREWTYEITLSADAVWAAVEETLVKKGGTTENYKGNIVALGVADGGLVVAAISATLDVAER